MPNETNQQPTIRTMYMNEYKYNIKGLEGETFFGAGHKTIEMAIATVDQHEDYIATRTVLIIS